MIKGKWMMFEGIYKPLTTTQQISREDTIMCEMRRDFLMLVQTRVIALDRMHNRSLGMSVLDAAMRVRIKDLFDLMPNGWLLADAAKYFCAYKYNLDYDEDMPDWLVTFVREVTEE